MLYSGLMRVYGVSETVASLALAMYVFGCESCISGCGMAETDNQQMALAQ